LRSWLILAILAVQAAILFSLSATLTLPGEAHTLMRSIAEALTVSIAIRHSRELEGQRSYDYQVICEGATFHGNPRWQTGNEKRLLRLFAEAAEETPEQPALPRKRWRGRRSLRHLVADGLVVVGPRDGVDDLRLIE